MISVIVPVYNAEAYLEKCVRSILAQTYTELEILLVNDGSRDGSLALCEKLAAEDARIRVMDFPNGGAAAARNRGLDAARGEYISFIDSDDTIHREMYQILIQLIEENEADVVECGFLFVSETGECLKELSLGSRVAETREDCIRQYAFFENTANGPCNKLYRRSVIGDVRFPAYAQAEDAVFNLKVYLQCNKRITIPECYYYYLQRSDSGGHRSRAGNERDVVHAWREIRGILAEALPYPCPLVQEKIVAVILRQYGEMITCRPKNWRKISQQLKKDYILEYPKQYTKCNPMSLRQKIGFILFCVSARVYHWINYGRKIIK